MSRELQEDKESWEPTGRGGFRRTGVAQTDRALRRFRRGRRVPSSPRYQHFEWARKLGLSGCPYVIRWKIETPVGSIRLHHWLGPDDDRAFHDHPWWFLTLVLKGGYIDVSPDGDDHLYAPAIRYRPALHQHTVVPECEGAWTLVITGPKIRDWGFWKNGKFSKANKWFSFHGHHPCS